MPPGFPASILALPFVVIFWLLYSLSPHIDAVQPANLALAELASFEPVTALLRSLGQSLFSPSIWSGLLFLAGVLLSNWRQGVLAILGAAIGTAVSYYYRRVDPTGIDFGLYGFNGVLTAVGVYVICGNKLRLAVLGALAATILTPALADAGSLVESGSQAACAPFLLATWLVLGLGRLDETWFSERKVATGTDPEAQSNEASDIDRNRLGD